MTEMRITLRLIELKGGGFIIAEETMDGERVDFDATQAVSTIDEACGSVQRILRTWADDCRRLRLAREDDEKVIPLKKAPRLWWRNAG
jgi:hypothetical protein